MSATYVYVIEAVDDTLYVGHTQNLFQRLKRHGREPWAGRIVKVRAEVFAHKSAATEYERNLILDLEPEFNVQGNTRNETFEQWLVRAAIA